MKYSFKYLLLNIDESHPARGAWIEIRSARRLARLAVLSHPARGAWIEIKAKIPLISLSPVAPRKGCVD